MTRTKKICPVTQWGNTNWITNDCGIEKNPRFELYNTTTKEILAKSNNPNDFNEYKYLIKIFGKEAANHVRDFWTQQEEKRTGK